jgi:hypothetical protein
LRTLTALDRSDFNLIAAGRAGCIDVPIDVLNYDYLIRRQLSCPVEFPAIVGPLVLRRSCDGESEQQRGDVQVANKKRLHAMVSSCLTHKTSTQADSERFQSFAKGGNSVKHRFVREQTTMYLGRRRLRLQ